MDDEPEVNDTRMPARGVKNKLRQAASSFIYPITPDIAAKERIRIQAYQETNAEGKVKHGRKARIEPGKPKIERRRLVGWAFAVLAALFIGLMLVTPVRARLIEWLRIGAVRIFLNQPKTPVELPLPTQLEDLAGETTLARAIAETPFSLMLPSYPTDLGEPEWVYLQNINNTPVVIFVWPDSQGEGAARLALYQIGIGDVFHKELLQNVQETTINGLWALWVEGPYILTTTDGQIEQRRVVQGRTLIWTENEVTYRLETSLLLVEARKIAESLEPVQSK